MRIVCLSDIHANFPALCRALDGARRAKADRIICAGDLVGFGPHPTEVVRLLMEQGVECIQGNVERKVLAYLQKPKKLKKRLQSRTRGSTAWAAMVLGEAERTWLADLPRELRFRAGRRDLWVVHGSPLGDTDYLYPSVTRRGLLAKLRQERADLLICGHSHIPFVREVAGVKVVNCGSVGRPVDGDPRGSYAVCDLPERGGARARIVRFTYPLEPLLADLKDRKALGARAEEYLSGTKIKDE
jgi:putative phosphoesterase